MAKCASKFPLFMIFSVAAHLGSCKMTTVCHITYIYVTHSLEHSSITLSGIQASHPESDIGGKWCEAKCSFI